MARLPRPGRHRGHRVHRKLLRANYGNPIFGVVGPDSFLYKPILYWFIGTGFPLAAFLWTKGIAGANEAAELQDELDGY